MFSWMTNPTTKTPSPPTSPVAPAFTPATIRCLRIPADGAKPHFLQRETIYINNEKLPDCFLYHIPDVRAFWNAAETGKCMWGARALRRVDVTGQPNGSVDGCYYFFRCCYEHLPRNPYFSKESRVKGDVFVVRVKGHGGYLDPVEYLDTPTELLEDRHGRTSLRLMMDAYVSYKSDQI